MPFKRILAYVSVTVSLVALSACGGGGGEQPASPAPSPPPAPVDTTPPAITLNGAMTVVVPFAAAYREEGASAVDDVDGAVSVVISGNVDTRSAGVYTVTYSAEDSAGNQSELIRTIEVLPQRVDLVISTVGTADYSLASGKPLDCTTRAGECRVTLEAGAVATITATAGPNHRFVRWQNCDSTAGEECTVTLKDNRTVLSTVVSTEPIVFQPNVVELSADQVSSLINYQSDGETLEFEAGVDMTGIAVGNVLLASVTSPDSVVFGRRILALETSPKGTLLARTETPTLPEVIRSGTVVATVGFTDPAAGLSFPGGSFSEAMSASSDASKPGSAMTQKPIQISLGGNTSLVLLDDGTVRVALTGEISIAPQFEFIYHLEDEGGLLPKPKEWRWYAATELRGSFRTSISGPVVDALNLEKNIPLGPAVSGLAVSPVPIEVEVQPVIGLALALTVALEPGFDVGLKKVLTGVQWNPSTGVRALFHKGEPLDEEGRIFTPVGIDSINGSLTFSATPGLQATAKVLGLAGPFIESGFVGKATVSFQPFADCEAILSAYAAIRWAAGGKLDLLFYESEFQLAESEIALRIGSPDIPLACSNPPSGSGDTEPPDAVNGIVVFAPDVPGRLSISWNEANDAIGIANYKVWRFRADEDSPQPVLAIETGITGANDSNLIGNTTYCYSVTAEDVLGNASDVPPNEDFVCATTVSDDMLVDLDAPTLLSASPVAGQSIELVWSSSNDSELATDFIVFALTDSGVPRNVLSTSETRATVSGLDAGKNYCFVVAIRDSRSRVSAVSNIVCAIATDAPDSSLQGWIALADGDPGVPGDGILVESQNIICSPDCWTVTTLDESPAYILASGADGFTVSSYFVDTDRPNRVAEYIPRFQFIDYSGPCGFSLGLFNPRIAPAPVVEGVGGTTVIISRDYANELAADLVEQRPECTGANAENLFISTIPGDGTRRYRADGVYVGIGNDPFIQDTLGQWVSFFEGSVGVPGDGLSIVGLLVDGKQQFTIEEEVVLGGSDGLTLTLYSPEIGLLDAIETTVVFGYTGFPESCRDESSALGFSDAERLRDVAARYHSFRRDILSLTTSSFSLSGPEECRGISVDNIYIAELRVNGIELPLDAAFVGIGEDSYPFFFDLP